MSTNKWRRIGLHCINCGNKQSEGKFCAICGMTLGSQIIDVEKAKSRITIRTDTQTNDYIEKLKAVSKMYWTYFLTYLRRPSEVLKQGGKRICEWHCKHRNYGDVRRSSTIHFIETYYMASIHSIFFSNDRQYVSICSHLHGDCHWFVVTDN